MSGLAHVFCPGCGQQQIMDGAAITYYTFPDDAQAHEWFSFVCQDHGLVTRPITRPEQDLLLRSVGVKVIESKVPFELLDPRRRDQGSLTERDVEAFTLWIATATDIVPVDSSL